MAHKLNEIQVIMTCAKNHHEVIERKVKQSPKTYADIIQDSTINTKEKAIAEMCSQQ
jgi:hypothetical protein